MTTLVHPAVLALAGSLLAHSSTTAGVLIRAVGATTWARHTFLSEISGRTGDAFGSRPACRATVICWVVLVMGVFSTDHPKICHSTNVGCLLLAITSTTASLRAAPFDDSAIASFALVYWVAARAFVPWQILAAGIALFWVLPTHYRRATFGQPDFAIDALKTMITSTFIGSSTSAMATALRNTGGCDVGARGRAAAGS